MKILDKLICAFRAPVSVYDRILEILALIILVGMVGFTAFLYQQAPGQVPIRFDSNGCAISWADKSVYWYMAVFFIIMMLISAAASYDVNFKMVHVPFHIKEPVRRIQQQLISRMSRYVTVCISLMWLAYLLDSSASFLDLPFTVSIYSNLSLLFLLAVVGYFSVKSWWVGRHY